MKNTLVATLLLASCGYLSYAQNNVIVKGQIKRSEEHTSELQSQR